MDGSTKGLGEIAAVVAPIHRLTANELVIIFCLLKDMSSSNDFTLSRWSDGADNTQEWNWITITHVCRYWRTTALEHAPLWSTLPQYLFANPQMLRTFIQRSKNADLDVISAFPRISEKEFLIEVLQHIGRIRHLNLYIPQFLDDSSRKSVMDHLAHPAPRLQELNLSGNRVARDVGSVDLSIMSPSLKRLSLTAFSVSQDLSFITVSGIVQLKLCRIEGTVTHSGFLSLLKSNPNMEILHIEDIYWNITTEDSLQSTKGVAVSLPKLTRLTVVHHNLQESESRFGYDEILKCLDIPREASWECWFTAQKKKTLSGMQFLPHLSQPDKSSAREMLKMQVFHSGFNIEYVNSFPVAEGLVGKSESNASTTDSTHNLRKSKLHFSWSDHSVSQDENVFKSHGIESLLDRTPWRDAKSVQIELISSRHSDRVPLYIKEDLWVSLLLKFTSVESVQFTDDLSSCRNLETFLGVLVPRNQDDSVVRRDELVCQNLSSLSLKLPYQLGSTGIPKSFIQTLKDALQIRKQMGKGLKTLMLMSPRGIKYFDKSDLGVLSGFVDRIYKI